MRRSLARSTGLASVAIGAVLVLAGCGGGTIDEQTKANESTASTAAGECGDLNMAVNPSVGYEADAYVVGYIAETGLVCNVN